MHARNRPVDITGNNAYKQKSYNKYNLRSAFSWYTVKYPKKIHKVSEVIHGTAQKKCYILYLATENAVKHNQCDIRVTHDGEVKFNIVEYKTAFPYSGCVFYGVI